MWKRSLVPLFLLLILADTVFSFFQFLHGTVLDGDMASIILPAEYYRQVLSDPFGFSALFSGERYAAPNRFFAHWFMAGYFKQVPAFLQQFVSPVDSVYLACALLKTGIQLLIACLLARFVSGTGNWLRKDFLLAAVLIVPLFQNTAYQGTMGILDISMTYTCFYALPLGLLLLFFLPFYKSLYAGEQFQPGIFQHALLVVLAVVLAFSGPVVPGLVLVASGLVLYSFLKNPAGEKIAERGLKYLLAAIRRIPGPFLFYIIFFSLLCLYSIYLGTFNLENSDAVPILERYARLPLGIFKQLSLRLGLPLLLLAFLLNAIILKKQKASKPAARILTVLKWLALFSLIYILLLPLGGYRDYRPNLIRRDTIMPVILCLLYGYGLSTFFLLKHFSGRYKIFYTLAVVVFLAIFTNADIQVHYQNQCERAALETIARSPETIVRLNSDCTVLSWILIPDYRDSELQGRLLQQWGITDGQKYFFQE